MMLALSSSVLSADHSAVLRAVSCLPAVALVAASFCDVSALFDCSNASGVVRVGVGSAGAGVFHGPVRAQSRSCWLRLRA